MFDGNSGCERNVRKRWKLYTQSPHDHQGIHPIPYGFLVDNPKEQDLLQLDFF